MLALLASVRTKSKKSCRFAKISLRHKLPVPMISAARAGRKPFAKLKIQVYVLATYSSRSISPGHDAQARYFNRIVLLERR
jgi:enolase